jgi:hypothetical protein
MKRSINAFRLANDTLHGGAELTGTVDIIARERATKCNLNLHGNNKGLLLSAWNTLNIMIENETTDCTMDELIGALDILNELIDQTQLKED